MDSLAPNEVKHIANVSKIHGQQILARHLRLFGTDFSEDLRAGAFVDYFYDVLQFSTKRGMGWNEVAQSLKFADRFLQLCAGATIVKSIANLHAMSLDYAMSGYIRLENVKKLIRYFTDTVLANYHLYQFVFAENREEQTSKMQLMVETPPTCMDLSTSETLETWEYKIRLQDIKIEEERKFGIIQKEEELMKIRVSEKESEFDEQLSEQEKLYDVDVKIAEALMSSLTSNQIDIAQEDIQIEIKKMKTSAEIAASVQAIPIPLQPQMKPSATVSKPKSPSSRKSSGKSATSKKKKK